jgi:hypothetical protein
MYSASACAWSTASSTVFSCVVTCLLQRNLILEVPRPAIGASTDPLRFSAANHSSPAESLALAAESLKSYIATFLLAIERSQPLPEGQHPAEGLAATPLFYRVAFRSSPSIPIVLVTKLED